jgi:uncharacterized protein YdeI (YjbR/CyaY-like superfamily)
LTCLSRLDPTSTLRKLLPHKCITLTVASDIAMDKTIEFESASQWDNWLAKNHSKSNGIWIRLFKKASGVSSVSVSDAVDVALCYGWITGQSRPYDEKSWLDQFVPRRPKSIWSKINTKRAEMLIKQGRMKPAGLKQVEEARRDGRWDRAYSPPSTAKLPQDFIKALRKNKQAEKFFKTLNRANTYSVVFRLETAKNEEQRKMKIKKMIKMFERGEKFH